MTDLEISSDEVEKLEDELDEMVELHVNPQKDLLQVIDGLSKIKMAQLLMVAVFQLADNQLRRQLTEVGAEVLLQALHKPSDGRLRGLMEALDKIKALESRYDRS